MGIVRMGPPEDIACFIKESCGVTTFVETGTFQGHTAQWASSLFEKVITIEFAEKFYKEAVEKYGHLKNIEFLEGDSRIALKKIVNAKKDDMLFWLDAHWCGMGSYGEKDQCPLIEELLIINESSFSHFILIDDARLFMAPPPLPNKIDFYPDIRQLLEVLTSNHERSVFVIEDVIIAVPQKHKMAFAHLLQEKTTEAWHQKPHRSAVPEKRSVFSALIGRIRGR